MVKKMDGLMKRREEEMKVWKEKAKEKLTTASNTIKKLKTEYDTVKMSNTKVSCTDNWPVACQCRVGAAGTYARVSYIEHAHATHVFMHM